MNQNIVSEISPGANQAFPCVVVILTEYVVCLQGKGHPIPMIIVAKKN